MGIVDNTWTQSKLHLDWISFWTISVCAAHDIGNISLLPFSLKNIDSAAQKFIFDFQNKEKEHFYLTNGCDTVVASGTSLNYLILSVTFTPTNNCLLKDLQLILLY